MRAISSLSREVGISVRSCNALLALRIRVSMSATGSVSTSRSSLPAALGHAGDHALVGELAQADPAEPELLEHGARPPAAVAARVVAHLELLRARRLDDERLLRHLLIPPCLCRERQTEPEQQRAGLVVR